MCRLYGFRANEKTKLECTLVYAQNALLSQSIEDERGQSHPDGWGIGFYENSHPKIERRVAAAYEGLHFSLAAERAFSRTVIAHVRKATVGEAAPGNVHPFEYGLWTFAHNGTIHGIERLREGLERETDPAFLAQRRGDTDSELGFYWLLSRLAANGIDIENRGADPVRVGSILQEAILDLDQRSRDVQAEREAKLNFLLTDGEMLVASRLRRSLYMVLREGVHDCEICGIPHVHHDESKQYIAVVIASEPITEEHWQEVPNGGVVVVTPDMRVKILPARTAVS